MAHGKAPDADATSPSAPDLPGRVLAAAAASLCLSLSAWALIGGWADLGARWGARALSQWEEQGRISDSGVLGRAHARLQRARRVAPLDAGYAADLARLHDWQALFFPPASRPAGAHRRRALSYHALAVSLRPSWGVGWAELARARVLAGGVDALAAASMRRAVALGPWEPAVQRVLIWLGFATWQTLTPDLRGSVLDLVARSARIGNRVAETTRLAARYGLVEEVAPLLRQGPRERAAGRGG